jgi:hypothetical protein
MIAVIGLKTKETPLRWKTGRRSDNIEDRRGMRVGRKDVVGADRFEQPDAVEPRHPFQGKWGLS